MTLRAIAAAFDAIAMVAFAYVLTSGSFADSAADVVFWGSAAAAVVAALVVVTRAAPLIGWVAVGYVLFAALLAVARPLPVLVLLAVAFMPLLDRPRGSLVFGLGASVAVAAVLAVLVRAVP